MSQLNLSSIALVITISLQHLFCVMTVVRIRKIASTIFVPNLLRRSVLIALTHENTRSTKALEMGVLKHARA